MSTKQHLKTLGAERDALLLEAATLLKGDERVVAAWLYGSLGRGTADEWSDIDLWVVVADSHIEEICAGRRDYVAALGEPLLVVDAPQNAPAGGAFLTVLYEGSAGSRHVDWTWQRQSDAHVPIDARLLFDRVGLPKVAPPPPQTPKERIEKAKHQTAYFWMMVPIVAKYVARGRAWGAVNLLHMLRYTLEEISELTGQGNDSPFYGTKSTLPPPSHPAEQLAMLREMAREMERFISVNPTLEEAVSPEALRQVQSHIDLAEVAITACAG
ncbi:MAG: nucleotidyltransferase domain-containing protein [Chloroflexia bacterium]